MPKSYTQKNGTTWEWNETPELREYIEQQKSKQESSNEKTI